MAVSNARKTLIAHLNEDLAREYQAIIAYVVYSQTLRGAEYMAVAKELEVHASTREARAMLRADLENENNTVRAYRERVKECEVLSEFAIAEDIREILIQEQEHQIDLATALGEDVPDVSSRRR